MDLSVEFLLLCEMCGLMDNVELLSFWRDSDVHTNILYLMKEELEWLVNGIRN